MASSSYLELIREGSQLVSCGALDPALEIFHAAHIAFACPNAISATRSASSMEARRSTAIRRHPYQSNVDYSVPDIYEHAACDCGPCVIESPVVPSWDAANDPILVEAVILYNKALVYHLKKNIAAAEPLYQSARRFIEELLHNTVQSSVSSLIEVSVRCFNNLGALRYKLDDSPKLFRMASKLAQTIPDRLECATVLSNLCRVQWLRGIQDNDIKQHLQTVLEIRLTVYGDKHPHVAATRYNLSLVHYHEPCTALEYLDSYLQTTSLNKSALSPIPALIQMLILQSKTSALKSSSNSGFLEVVCTLRDQRHFLGPNSPQLTHVLSRVGTLLFYQQNLSVALDFLCEELRVEKLHGNVPVSTYYNIGRVLQEMGRMDEAIHHYHTALASDPSFPTSAELKAMERSGAGIMHLSNADLYSTVWYNLGGIQDQRGAHQDAIHSFQMSLQLRKIILGGEHPNIACLHYNIGVLQIEQECLEEASASLNEALSIRLRTAGGQFSDHHIVRTLNSLAVQHKSRGNFERAMESYHQSFSVIQVSVELDETTRHQESGSTLRLMAELLSDRGHIQRALEHSINSVQLLTAARNQRTGKEQVAHMEHLVSALLMLGSLYHELCEPIKAIRILEQAAQVVQQTAAQDGVSSSTPRSLIALLEVTTMLKLCQCAPQA